LTAAEISAQIWRKSFGWILIAVLLLVEYGLFRQFAEREVAWAYPANHDQTVFLSQTYETYETILDQGLWAGLWHGFNVLGPQNTLAHLQASLRENSSPPPAARRSATGALIHIQGALLFLMLGPSRLSALTLNFLYFALLQLVLAWTLHWLTRRWSVALIGVGILLTAVAPFYYVGGLMDFRIDFIALCIYGVLMGLVLRSGVFASRRWSLVAGAVSALLVLFRFITAVYLTGIFGLLVPYFCFRLCRRRRDPAAWQVELRRLTGLLTAGLILALVTGPVLWHRREAIKHYYIVGHVTGQEKHIRAQQFSANHPYAFYTRSLLLDQAGPTFLTLCALMFGIGLVLALRAKSAAQRARDRAGLDVALAYVFLGTSLVVPLIILPMHISPSPVVVNIVLTPLLCLVLLSLAACTGLHRTGRRRRFLEFSLAVLAVVAMGVGIWEQFSQYGRRSPMSLRRADIQKVLRLYAEIGKYCRAFNLKAPRISTNTTVDYLNFNVARVLLYERQGLACEPQPGLGSNIFAVTKPEALAIGRQSDFVIISQPSAPRESVYPFEKCMKRITPALTALCKRNYKRLKSFHLGDTELTLFVRPNPRQHSGNRQ
jgi:hypothetical protein